MDDLLKPSVIESFESAHRIRVIAYRTALAADQTGFGWRENRIHDMPSAKIAGSLAIAMGLLSAVLGVSCHPPDPPANIDAAKCPNVDECTKLLMQTSTAEASKLAAEDCSEKRPTRDVAIIGNGIAATAAALHLPSVRVYGRPSFWTRLEGLPAVWQTTLDDRFGKAFFISPSKLQHTFSLDGARIPREAVLFANYEGLVRANAAYLETEDVTVTQGPGGTWSIVGSEGHRETARSLVVATGLLRALRITDVVSGAEALQVRRRLLQDGRIVTGDEFLAKTPELRGRTVGILGTGGSATDCLDAAFRAHATGVVMWGLRPNEWFTNTDSYKAIVSKYEADTCRVEQLVAKVAYDNEEISINGAVTPVCSNKGGTSKPVDLMVESLGRYEGDPPPVVLSAAGGREIHYWPRAEPGSGALIGIKATFGDKGDSARMYIIGASATWIPPGVRMSAADLKTYTGALDRTVKVANGIPTDTDAVTGVGLENGPPSFAVAAYMGSRVGALLAQKIDPQ